MTPGRNCPLHYRYAPADLAYRGAPGIGCLYVVGGLYGNLAALETIGTLAARESEPPTIVFNGDFNWFNTDDAGFAAINMRVLAHTALRGNVETELATDDATAGCGCGYPAFVSDADVERSNRILDRLRDTARANTALRQRLAALPMHMTVAVGAARVAIVHGDCESLAGWGLSREALATPAQRARAGGWFDEARIDIIASSHSCLPVLLDIATPDGTGIVANNGAAGMPNFARSHFGVITRIGLRPSPHQAVYGTHWRGVHIDALPVHYDQSRWRRAFLANWPANSPAHISYWRRITHGPDYRIEDACQLTESRARDRRPIAARPSARQRS